ncbi:MAG: EAL domain-containing protein [Betaproteobacteria bacterium]
MTSAIRNTGLARGVLMLGIALSIAAWFFVGGLVEQQAKADFDRSALATLGAIERRTQRYIDILHGLEGLLGHDPSVSRLAFQRYVNSLNLATRFPGVQAVEFIRRVRLPEKTVYEGMVRDDRNIRPGGFPDFSIKPGGARDEYYVVHYVEPAVGNEDAFGLDIRTRRAALTASERARDVGEPIITGRYQLAQEKQNRLGLVVYLPIYETYRQNRTLAQRRSELAGFVNLVFRVDSLFAQLADPDLRNNVDFLVFDVGASNAAPSNPTTENLLYSSVAMDGDAGPTNRGDGVSHTIVVAGRHWYFKFSDLAAVGHPMLQPQSLLVLLLTLVISFLLFTALRTASRSQINAQQMADGATRELRDQLSFSRQLIEAIPTPIFFKDASGKYFGCNRAFEEFANRPRSDFIGKTVLEVTDSEAAHRHHTIEAELLKDGGKREYEMSLTRTTDGKLLDAIFTKAAFVNTDGKIAGLVGAIVEITERKSLERTLSESNQRLRSIIEGSPLAIIARDLNGVIGLWNPAAEKLFGWTANEVMGTVRSTVPEEVLTEVLAMRKQVEAGTIVSQVETRRVGKDGVVLDVSLSVAPIHDASQKIVGSMALMANISRRKRAEDELRNSEAQLRLAMEAADMGSWLWNIDSGTMSFSEGFGPLVGMQRGAVIRDYAHLMSMIHPDDRSTTDVAVLRALKLNTSFDLEYRVVWPDGTVRWMAVRGQITRNASGKAQRIIGVSADVTSRKQAEQRIAYLAHHDALTGLPNRVLLQDRIEQAIAHSHRNATQLAVMFIDLDHFKNINDSLGHQQGDTLLQLVAARILNGLREIDTVSRLGGDEFVIVIPALSPQDEGSHVTAVAQKVLESLAASFQVQSHELNVGASIGISIYPTDGETAEILMRNADAAMYHAKGRGRNQYQFFTAAMNAAAQQRMTLQTQLRRSLQTNDFCLHYQPVYSVSSHTLIGFEALLRWRNMVGELIRPGEFISVAEDSGLIIPIGEWVIGEACRTAALWQQSGKRLQMAINVSAIQLRRKTFVDTFAAILAETGADPRLIEMEVTESVIVGGHEEAITALTKLDAMKIRIAIDDFGTGYSGLSYLKQFPIHTVKIDQSFIRDLTTDTENEAIVRAIIAMSRSLGLNIVAEGVETATQLAMLSELGCDLVQGYYFSQPLSLAEANNLIANQKSALLRSDT